MKLRLVRIVWIALLISVLAAGCASDSPEDIARNFYTAFERHEYTEAKKLACEHLHDELELWRREVGEVVIDVEFDVKYELVSKDDESQTFKLTGTRAFAGETYAVNYEIRVDKGEDGWQVCNMAAL